MADCPNGGAEDRYRIYLLFFKVKPIFKTREKWRGTCRRQQATSRGIWRSGEATKRPFWALNPYLQNKIYFYNRACAGWLILDGSCEMSLRQSIPRTERPVPICAPAAISPPASPPKANIDAKKIKETSLVCYGEGGLCALGVLSIFLNRYSTAPVAGADLRIV